MLSTGSQGGANHYLHYRLTIVQKLGNRSYKLRGGERLGQKDALGHALDGPFLRIGTGNVDDRQTRIDRSRARATSHPLIPSLPSLISITNIQ
jgi:hypothetical protein